MDLAPLVDQLETDGRRLGDAAGQAGLDAPVPPCPEWNVRDLLRHIGQVHRWAAAHVAGARTEPIGEDEMQAIVGDPSDAGLVDWYRDGHAALLQTLRDAPADVNCWSFLRAPTPLLFWARRQAHETAIHRVDAEVAAGPVTGFPAAFAADGVDELLTCFVTRRRGHLRADPARTLHVHADDTPGDWQLVIGPERVETTVGPGEADATMSGPAAALYVSLWNRPGGEAVRLDGDQSLGALWRDAVRVRWA